MKKQMMIRNTLAGGLLWVALTAGAGAKDTGFFLHDGDAVVFLGDSITEQKLYSTYLEAYALTRFPKWQFSSKDLIRWEDCTAQMVPLPGYRHGTVIEIPGTVARTLIEHYGYNLCPLNLPRKDER